MPRKICYREQKGIFRSAERQNGRCLLGQANTLKNCVAKQRISLGAVQTAIDNNLITLPGWDGY